MGIVAGGAQCADQCVKQRTVDAIVVGDEKSH
jgi:hypothetical protein